VKRYRFLREALEEYEDAISYYENARSGLGHRVADEIEHVIALTLEFPEMGAPVADTPPELRVRRQLVRRFDVEIDYLVSGDTIVILAVFHCKRRPGYWKDRLRRIAAAGASRAVATARAMA
jgi:plasmid stabilization system protein ParE